MPPGRSGDPTLDQTLEQAILSLLDQRGKGTTICPSEVARAVGGSDWRPLMEPTRAAARRLVACGEVQILQRRAVVEPSTAKGPIRIGRHPGASEPHPVIGDSR